MTPENKAALETLLGRELSPAEVLSLDPAVEVRNDVEVAAQLAALLPPVIRSLTVEEVFDVLFSSGDWLTIKSSQMSGNPVAVMAFAILSDAKTLGNGKVNLTLPATVGLLDQLQGAGLLSQSSRNALLAKATSPSKLNFNAVSRVLNSASGIENFGG